jgi:hypothetical protein
MQSRELRNQALDLESMTYGDSRLEDSLTARPCQPVSVALRYGADRCRQYPNCSAELAPPLLDRMFQE